MTTFSQRMFPAVHAWPDSVTHPNETGKRPTKWTERPHTALLACAVTRGYTKSEITHGARQRGVRRLCNSLSDLLGIPLVAAIVVHAHTTINTLRGSFLWRRFRTVSRTDQNPNPRASSSASAMNEILQMMSTGLRASHQAWPGAPICTRAASTTPQVGSAGANNIQTAANPHRGQRNFSALAG